MWAVAQKVSKFVNWPKMVFFLSLNWSTRIAYSFGRILVLVSDGVWPTYITNCRRRSEPHKINLGTLLHLLLYQSKFSTIWTQICFLDCFNDCFFCCQPPSHGWYYTSFAIWSFVPSARQMCQNDQSVAVRKQRNSTKTTIQ